MAHHSERSQQPSARRRSAPSLVHRKTARGALRRVGGRMALDNLPQPEYDEPL